MIAGVVLAAGASRRFGETPKQLAELDGRPLLEHALAAMSSAPVDRTVVVLGAHADEIEASVELHGAQAVPSPDWATGQAASLRAGLEAVPDAECVVIALGDQPLLASRAIVCVLAARDPSRYAAVRAAYDGRPGHPIVLERALFERLGALTGDAGARELLAHSSVRDVACDGLGRPDDIDTPEELEVARV